MPDTLDSMNQASRFARLFEPVRIGPVTAPNRFYQVPHCTGMGYTYPQTLAAMREVKAEGGWGVVHTEYCSIHPTSAAQPAQSCSLWDEGDAKNMAVTTAKGHDGGRNNQQRRAAKAKARHRRASAESSLGGSTRAFRGLSIRGHSCPSPPASKSR